MSYDDLSKLGPNYQRTYTDDEVFDIINRQTRVVDSADIYDDRILRLIRSEGLPRVENANQPTTNSYVTTGSGAQLRTNSSIAGQNLSCNSERGSQYGQVSVTQTEGGHVIELNDTLGSERILIKHVNGSGVEIRADGSILISSKNIVFDVEGDLNFVATGNLNFNSRGNVTFDTGGQLVTKNTGYQNIVEGSAVESISGRKDVSIRGNSNTLVRGTTTATHVGAQTITNLGGMQQSVRGDLTLRVDGNGGIYSSGNLGLTAQTRAFMSSPSVAINSNNMQIIGATGTIGGGDIVMYNYNMYTSHTITAGDTLETQAVHADRVNATSMHSTTFHGDLNGKALTAALADKATGATTAGSLGSSGTAGSITNTTQDDVALDDKATFLPTSAIADARLKTLLNGVRQVQVDPGNYIRNSIDRSYATTGTQQ